MPERVIPPAHSSPDPPPAIPPSLTKADPPDAGAKDSGNTIVLKGQQEDMPIKKSDAVIASLRPRFKACYQAGLRTNPKMVGKVVLAARVTADGAVESVVPGPPQGLSADVVTCLADVLKSATFQAPGGGGGSLNVPVQFKGK
jgi:hypothetical protein